MIQNYFRCGRNEFTIEQLFTLCCPSLQESSVAEVENEISRDILDISNTTTRVRQLQDVMDNLNEEIHQKNGTISKIEGEIVKRNAIIERKQSTIDQFNKKIDQLRSKDGVRQWNFSCWRRFTIIILQISIDHGKVV